MNTKTALAIAAALLLMTGTGVAIMTGTPRGIRNNNPGNIRKGTSWQGLATDQNDPAFAVFALPEYGLRALAITLRTYQTKYGINTIAGAIARYAPASENNTQAYINAVAAHVGASPDAPLDFTNAGVLRLMLEAITMHENGVQPYSVAVLNRAMGLAGVVA